MAPQLYIVCLYVVTLLTFFARGQEPLSGGQRDNANQPPQRRRTSSNGGARQGDLLPGAEHFQDTPGDAVTCRQRNKCSQREGIDLGFYDQNCFCDDLCKMYGDCCKDYTGSLPSTLPVGFKLSKRTLSCDRVIPIDQTAEIYRVDKCPKDYEDAFFREKCEDSHSLDQFLEIPVSGVDTGVLYKNYYCAVCAGDENVVFWNVKWQCESGPKFQNLSNTEQLLDDVWIMGAGNCIYEFTHPTMTYRKCKSHLSRCPKFWDGDPIVERKCRLATAYTYVDSVLDFMVFGNEYCAECYGINSTYLTCRDPRGVGIRENRPHVSPTATFSILLDIPTGTGIIKSQEGEGAQASDIEQQVVFRQCEQDHVYDPFNKICRRVTCPPELYFVQGHCATEDSITSTSKVAISTSKTTPRLVQTPVTLTTRRSRPSTRRATTEFLYTQRPPATTPRRNNYYDKVDISFDGVATQPKAGESGSPLLNCPLMTYNQQEYIMLQNRSVVIISEQKMYERGNYIVQENVLYVCTPINTTENTWLDNAKVLMFQFDRIQKLVCMIGIIVSLLFLSICFVVHMILPPIRTTPGKCIIGLTVCLFIGHGLLLVVVLEIGVHNDVACLVMGSVMHYMFVAAFCWSNCLAVDLCKAFGSNRSAVEEAKTPNRYASYSVYSWFFPAFLVGGSVIIDMLDFSKLGVDAQVDMFRPYYGDGVCWITRRNALIFLFAAPLAILFTVNIITYIATICNMQTVPVVAKTAQRRDKDKNRFLLYIKYSLVLALTWVFALLAVLVHMNFLWYIFILFFSLQGSFLCAAFICTRKVFRLLKNLGRVHKSSSANGSVSRPYHRAYSSATASSPWAYSRSNNFLYEGMDAKIVSQETSI